MFPPEIEEVNIVRLNPGAVLSLNREKCMVLQVLAVVEAVVGEVVEVMVEEMEEEAEEVEEEGEGDSGYV